MSHLSGGKPPTRAQLLGTLDACGIVPTPRQLDALAAWFHLDPTPPRSTRVGVRCGERVSDAREAAAAELLAPVFRRIELDAAHAEAIREGWDRDARARFVPDWLAAMEEAVARSLDAVVERALLGADFPRHHLDRFPTHLETRRA